MHHTDKNTFCSYWKTHIIILYKLINISKDITKMHKKYKILVNMRLYEKYYQNIICFDITWVGSPFLNWHI